MKLIRAKILSYRRKGVKFMNYFKLNNNEISILNSAIDWAINGNIDKCISSDSGAQKKCIFKQKMYRISSTIASGETTLSDNMFDCFHDIMKAYGAANGRANEISDILIRANRTIKEGNISII